jgi:hypothetical protein
VDRERQATPGERGGLATATFRCWCGQTILAAGNPAVGVMVLRHDLDDRPLGVYDGPTIARLVAADPAVLREPKVRAWLRGYHPEP